MDIKSSKEDFIIDFSEKPGEKIFFNQIFEMAISTLKNGKNKLKGMSKALSMEMEVILTLEKEKRLIIINKDNQDIYTINKNILISLLTLSESYCTAALLEKKVPQKKLFEATKKEVSLLLSFLKDQGKENS